MRDTGDPRIQLTIDGAVAVVTVARPEKLNALDLGMIKALETAAQLVSDDVAIRAAIITGAGEVSFCAGGDIAAWSALSADDFAFKWLREGHRAFDALARLRQPLIAALNGHALGGGLELAVTADVRIAEPHVKIGLPETGIGVIPGWSGTQRAVRRLGAQSVRRMALAGEVFTAIECLALGLVDQVVDKGQSLPAARALAQRILTRGPSATALAKLMVNAAEGEDRDFAIEALAGRAAAADDELAEGVRAFRGRRKPQF
jgi:enoyl-CoA hydratase